MKILDNFLTDEAFKPIQDFFLGTEITWNFNKTITNREVGLNGYQFVHPFFTINQPYLNRPTSPFADRLKPIFLKLAPLSLLRVKANLRPYTPEVFLSDYHVDFELPCKTAIYYLNTNDGYTLFEEGTKVESVENRIVIFDSHMRHLGTSCTDEKSRVVLNINYLPGKLKDGVEYVPEK
tara:strand:- start:80 stop:616 length:537 start_codon:yes stop_codon:yes gene_type:complete